MNSYRSLNRTFYGIETGAPVRAGRAVARLNRTFYGIETCLVGGIGHQSDVLIVPFMELKPSEEKAQKKVAKGLNRTFYGIETGMRVIIISRLMMS